MSYTVHVTREDDQWLAEVPGLPGAHTFAGNLTKLDAAVREVVALVEDLPDGAEPALDLVWDFSAVDPALVEAAQIAAQRREIARTQDRLAARTRELAGQLADAKWSARDIAGALGVTPGYVSRITEPHHTA